MNNIPTNGGKQTVFQVLKSLRWMKDIDFFM